jgi:hypothetical protein
MGYNDPKWDRNAPVVPFNKDGNMTNYTWNAEWRRVYPFKSTMKIVSYSDGKNAATLTLEDDAGIQYPVFLSDFYEVLTRFEIKAGLIEETAWKFRKIGSAYSIMPDL